MMKILLTLILISYSMGFSEFQSLIGKNISKTSILLDNGFVIDANKNFYFKAEGLPSKVFYKMPCNYIIITNKSGIIDSITFYFNGIIDQFFYDEFINEFGKPNTIQVVEKIEVLDKGKSDKDSICRQYLEKRFLTTREGNFNEKPLYILWKNKDFEIRILQRYNQNTTEIIFRKPTDKF